MIKYQVGDIVYGSFGRYSKIDVKPGKVVKVTPTGRCNVDFGFINYGNNSTRLIKFDTSGRQIGGDQWHSYRLIDSETYERLAKEQAQQDALAAVQDYLRSKSFKDKATFDAFMAGLQELAEAVGDDAITKAEG